MPLSRAEIEEYEQKQNEKLTLDDDCAYYLSYYNGMLFKPCESIGYTTIEVLPQLKGLPFNNLTLAYLHALRPSTVRISTDGCVCCDAWRWRVTIFLDKDKLIEKIVQEVEVGYSCGAEVDRRLREALEQKANSELCDLCERQGCHGECIHTT